MIFVFLCWSSQHIKGRETGYSNVLPSNPNWIWYHFLWFPTSSSANWGPKHKTFLTEPDFGGGWWVLVGGLCVSNKAPAESAVIGEAAYSHFTQEPSHHSHISKYCIFLKQIKNSPFNTVSLLTFHPRTLYHAFHFNIYLILHSAEANCIHLNSLYCKVHDSSMSK